MLLILFSVSDSDNVIGKTMTEKERMNIVLKRDTDIINPVLLLATNSPNGFDGVNYAEIPDLGRYYFVESITNVNNTLWQLNLSCDVLETYKADILASNCRFTRGIKTGDSVGKLDASNLTTVTKISSNKGLVDGSTMIISTVGDQ